MQLIATRNSKLKFVYTLLITLYSIVIHAKDIDPTGNVTGLVLTSDGRAAAGININVAGLDNAVITDEYGAFYLSNLPVGELDLIVSISGNDSQKNM